MTKDKAEKAREARLRRLAEAQGLRLEKSRARNPAIPGYGTYRIVDNVSNLVMAYNMAADYYGLDLDEVEQWLTEGRDDR